MQYMLLLYSAPGSGPEPGSAEHQQEMQAWFAYSDALSKAGALVAGEPLQDVETATTVRVRSGDTVTSDGPFAETKEVLGGFYLLDVETRDEAHAWAAKCPLAPYGTVEVRPLMVLPER